MTVSIFDAAARAAFIAATSQQAQCEAIVAPWAGGNVIARVLGSGGVLRQTITLGPWTIAPTTPRGVRHGARLAFTTVSTGDIASIEYRTAGGALIFTATAGEGATAAAVDFAGPIRSLCGVTLTGAAFTGNPALPVEEVIAWSTASSDPGSLVASIWTPGRDARGIVTQASVNTLPANTWVRVAGTSLQTLRNAIEATGFDFATDDWSAGKDVRSIFNAWVGVADDGRRVVNPRGGGHADSSQNGVLSMDLLRMAWEVLRAPSQPDAPGAAWHPNYRIPPNGTYTNYTTTGAIVEEADGLYADMLPDGTPTSAHTYNGVWYDSSRKQFGTGRVSKWVFDMATRQWTRQRWSNGGTPFQFTVRQELHYHAATDALYGYFSLGDLDTASWGKVQFPGSNRVGSGTNPPNFALGNGGVGCSVRLDEDRILVLWCVFGVERWGIFNMLTETWEPGSGDAITDGKNIGNGNEMQICLLIPSWGAQGQVIRRGTNGALNGVWWLFDIATKANLPYTPLGVNQFTVWPGNKWRSIPHLGIAIGLDDNSAISTNALLVMRYAV